MDILILSASPVKDGNTETIVQMLIEQAPEHSFEIIRIADAHIEFCEGCHGCQSGETLLNCKHDDDFNGIVEKMKSSDLVLWASPLYVFGFPAQTKRFIDRVYSVVRNFKTSKAVSYLNGIKQMLLLTQIGPELVSQPCIGMFQLMTETLMGTTHGAFVAPFCTSERGVKRNGKQAVKEIIAALKNMDVIDEGDHILQ